MRRRFALATAARSAVLLVLLGLPSTFGAPALEGAAAGPAVRGPSAGERAPVEPVANGQAPGEGAGGEEELVVADAVGVELESHAVWPAWTEAWHAVEPLPGERFVRVPFWVPVAWNGDQASGGEWNRAVRGWAGLSEAPLPQVVGEALEVPAGAPLLARPFAAHPDHMQGVTISGRFSGPARLVVRGGDGRVFVHDLGEVVRVAPGRAEDAAVSEGGFYASDAVRANGARLAVQPGAEGWHTFTWSTVTPDLLVPRFEVAVGITPPGSADSSSGGSEGGVARFGAV